MSVNFFAIFVAVPIVGLVAFGVYFICSAWAEETGEAAPEAESGASGTAFTLSTWVLAGLYVAMGVPKLSSLSMAVHRFDQWGYPDWFMYLVGVVEFLGAIGLLLPKIRLVAALGLSVIMAGAIYTHIAFDPAVYTLLPVTALALLVFVAYRSSRREWEDD